MAVSYTHLDVYKRQGMDKDHLLVSLFSQGLFIFHKETHRYQPLVIINDSINYHEFRQCGEDSRASITISGLE